MLHLVLDTMRVMRTIRVAQLGVSVEALDRVLAFPKSMVHPRVTSVSEASEVDVIPCTVMGWPEVGNPATLLTMGLEGGWLLLASYAAAALALALPREARRTGSSCALAS